MMLFVDTLEMIECSRRDVSSIDFLASNEVSNEVPGFFPGSRLSMISIISFISSGDICFEHVVYMF